MKSGFAGVIVASVMAISGTAVAQNYSTNFFDVGEIADDAGCFIGSNWTPAGRSQINLEIDQMLDGEIFVGVWSYGWSRPSADLQKGMFFVFWDANNERQVVGLLAAPMGSEILSGEKPGLLAIVQPEERAEFLDAFASSRAFAILTQDLDNEDTSDFDRILEGGLTGSSLAVTRMQTCVSNVRRRVEAQRRREEAVAHIDPDPFRTERPKNDPGLAVLVNPEWARRPAAEFPERALSRGVQTGRVDLDCKLNSDGSLTECLIQSEHPVGMGFGQAALSGARRARVAPRAVDQAATDARTRFSVNFSAR